MLTKLIGLIALFAICNAQKIPVHVYYESLCPDSQAFITEQLYPVMKSPLGQYVNLVLVPFGKSNYSTRGSDVEFTCHHGPNECHGNKVQSCAIEHIQVNSYQNTNTRETLTLEYINCLMKMGNNFADSIYPGRKCAEEIKLNNWDTIEQCANSTEGSKVLQKNGELTSVLNPTLKSVPTITFRQQQDPEIQALSLSHFQAAVCKKLSPMPRECSNLPSGAKQHVAEASIIVAFAMILSKIF